MKKSRGSTPLTIDTCRLFVRICDEINAVPGQSIRILAAKLSSKTMSIFRAVHGVEDHFGVGKLLERGPRGVYENVLPSGRQVHDFMRATVAQWDRLNEFQPSMRETIRVSTTHAMLNFLITRAIAEFTRKYPAIDLSFHETDYPQILEDVKTGRSDVGFGPEVGEVVHGLEVKTLTAKTSLVAVYSRHEAEFVKESGQMIHKDRLATKRVLYLPEEIQPGVVSYLPPPRAPGCRIPVGSFSSILSLSEMGVGVGIVPGWYWVLDELWRDGRLHYSPVQGLPTVATAAYLPIHPARKVVHALVETVKVHMDKLNESLASKPGYPRRQKPRLVSAAAVGTKLSKYRFEYYVSLDFATVDMPEWREGKVTWLKIDGSQEFKLTFTDHKAGKPYEAYEASGKQERDLLWIVASSVREVWLAVFNAVVENDVLLGMWTGVDNAGYPISAPIALSPRRLRSPQLRRLTDLARRAHLRNAFTGFDTESEPSA